MEAVELNQNLSIFGEIIEEELLITFEKNIVLFRCTKIDTIWLRHTLKEVYTHLIIGNIKKWSSDGDIRLIISTFTSKEGDSVYILEIHHKAVRVKLGTTGTKALYTLLCKNLML